MRVWQTREYNCRRAHNNIPGRLPFNRSGIADNTFAYPAVDRIQAVAKLVGVYPNRVSPAQPENTGREGSSGRPPNG